MLCVTSYLNNSLIHNIIPSKEWEFHSGGLQPHLTPRFLSARCGTLPFLAPFNGLTDCTVYTDHIVYTAFSLHQVNPHEMGRGLTRFLQRNQELQSILTVKARENDGVTVSLYLGYKPSATRLSKSGDPLVRSGNEMVPKKFQNDPRMMWKMDLQNVWLLGTQHQKHLETPGLKK